MTHIDTDLCPACGSQYGPHQLCDDCCTDDLVLEHAARIIWRRTSRKTFTVRVICRVLGSLAAKIRNQEGTTDAA